MTDKVLESRVILLERKFDELFGQLRKTDENVMENAVLISKLTDLSARAYEELKQNKQDKEEQV